MSLSRRRFSAAALALPLIGVAPAAGRNDLTLILMGDLHSGYRWSSRLLRAAADTVAAANGLVRIVVNGDVFERHNVIATRNDGAIDRALLERFVALAPTIVTIGNHDSDLFDPRTFATDIHDAGAILLTDIVDPRTNAPYGPPSHTVIMQGGERIVFAALGTPNLAVYPPEWRSCYAVPDPAAYAAAHFRTLFEGATLPVALVHAGFEADRTVLPFLPDTSLLHGAHDHLRFSQMLGNRLHLQSGAWSNEFQVVTIAASGDKVSMRARDVVLDERSPQDRALQTLIEAERARCLHDEDGTVIGRLAAPIDLEHAVRRVADHLQRSAGVDLALLSHTTFGDGLPGGDVTLYDRASFLRFDGGIALGEIAPDRWPALRNRLNQFDGRTDYARRTGDYLHASDLDGLPADRPIKVAVNAYAVSTAANRTALFGWDVRGFARADQLAALSSLVTDAIKGGS